MDNYTLALPSPPPSSRKRYADFSIETLLSKSANDVSRGEARQQIIPQGSDHTNLICDSLNQDISVDVTEVEEDLNSCVSDCPNSSSFQDRKDSERNTFAWLSCTRFKPPKLMRSRKKVCVKRSGRGPRIPFSTHQLAILEKTFLRSQYLSSEAISRLADDLHLTETRVKIWFQNRRARFRREKNSEPQHLIPHSHCPKNRSPALSSSPQSKRKESVIANFKNDSNTEQHSPSSFISNKTSFRHLINDLNLIAANAASSTGVGNFNGLQLQFMSKVKGEVPVQNGSQFQYQCYSNHSTANTSSVR